MPKLISIKSQVGPALVSGGCYYQGFGEFEKVTHSLVQGDFEGVLNSGIGAVSGYQVKAYPVIVSSNQVRVNLEKWPTLASGVGAVVVAASGDIISNTITVLAFGE